MKENRDITEEGEEKKMNDKGRKKSREHFRNSI